MKSPSDKTPFSSTAVREHLYRSRLSLSDGVKENQIGRGRVSKRSYGLPYCWNQCDLDAGAPDTRRLEDSLTSLERMLNERLRRCALGRYGIGSEGPKAYKSSMEPDVYKQTLDNLAQAIAANSQAFHVWVCSISNSEGKCNGRNDDQTVQCAFGSECNRSS